MRKWILFVNTSSASLWAGTENIITFIVSRHTPTVEYTAIEMARKKRYRGNLFKLEKKLVHANTARNKPVDQCTFVGSTWMTRKWIFVEYFPGVPLCRYWKYNYFHRLSSYVFQVCRSQCTSTLRSKYLNKTISREFIKNLILVILLTRKRSFNALLSGPRE